MERKERDSRGSRVDGAATRRSEEAVVRSGLYRRTIGTAACYSLELVGASSSGRRENSDRRGNESDGVGSIRRVFITDTIVAGLS